MPIPTWSASCLTISPAAIGGLSPQRPAPRSLQGLQSNMRLIARFVVLMVAVFGVSLAFAWAWDKSDKPHDAAAQRAAS